MSHRILVSAALAGTVLALSACQPAKQESPSASAAAPAAAPLAAAPAPAAAAAPVAAAPIATEAAAAPAPVNPHAALGNPHAMAPAAMPVNPHAGIALPKAAQATPAAVHGNQLNVQGYVGPVPAGWTSVPPASSMRAAQFAVPAAAGAEAGEAVVFFFGPGQGGSHEANIDRWISQFSSNDGKPVAPKVEQLKGTAGDITVVELHGSYARGVGMGPVGEAKPFQTLIVAMLEAPTGRITLQLYGPQLTVAAQRDGFLKLVRGFTHQA